MPALLVVAAAAAMSLKFRSKKVHGHTGRSHFKMAAFRLNASGLISVFVAALTEIMETGTEK